MKRRMKKIVALLSVAALAVSLAAGCGSGSDSSSDSGSKKTSSAKGATSTEMTSEEIIKQAASEGKVGNWGLGNEYEIEALLEKYGQPTDYLSQAFDMDGFDNDDITLASAMTFNELGLVKNDYDGGYGYGDTVGTIDMNDEGVAMLEDNIFCTKDFAQKNPNTVKSFIYASIKGWQYACEHPDEAAEIVYKYGSSVSADHQKYMAEQVAKLVTTDMNANTVTNIGEMSDDEMNQTLELAKKYIKLDDSAAAEKLQPHLIPSVILLIIQQPLHPQMEQILELRKNPVFPFS